MKSPVLWLSLLTLVACHDAGSDTLAAARAQYQALQKAGTPVQSRDYDAVLKTLAAIPDASRAKGNAQALARAIADARAQAPAPRAAAPATPAEELAAARVECDRLKGELNGLKDDARVRKQELLDACHRRVEKLEAVP